MKTALVFAFLFILSSDTEGQGHYPLGVGDLWQYWEVPGQYWNVQVVDDTLMPNGNTYMVLTGYGGGFLRQSGPIVLAYSPSLNDEYLLYDFSRTTGDTVTVRYPSDTIVVTVYSDQMETHFGRTLRTWVFYERSTTTSWYAMWHVADSLGLVSVQAEVLSYGLQGAIINGIQYGIVLGVSINENPRPSAFSLSQNYPNPFNPSTTIRFSLPQAQFVTLKIFDTLGEEVATSVSEKLYPGQYSTQLNATGLASGVYYYRLQAGAFIETKKLLLLK